MFVTSSMLVLCPNIGKMSTNITRLSTNIALLSTNIGRTCFFSNILELGCSRIARFLTELGAVKPGMQAAASRAFARSMRRSRARRGLRCFGRKNNDCSQSSKLEKGPTFLSGQSSLMKV